MKFVETHCDNFKFVCVSGVTTYNSQFYLTNPVATWAGITDYKASYGTGSYPENSLAEDNDRGLSFEEIAQIIEINF